MDIVTQEQLKKLKRQMNLAQKEYTDDFGQFNALQALQALQLQENAKKIAEKCHKENLSLDWRILLDNDTDLLALSNKYKEVTREKQLAEVTPIGIFFDYFIRFFNLFGAKFKTYQQDATDKKHTYQEAYTNFNEQLSLNRLRAAQAEYYFHSELNALQQADLKKDNQNSAVDSLVENDTQEEITQQKNNSDDDIVHTPKHHNDVVSATFAPIENIAAKPVSPAGNSSTISKSTEISETSPTDQSSKPAFLASIESHRRTSKFRQHLSDSREQDTAEPTSDNPKKNK